MIFHICNTCVVGVIAFEKTFIFQANFGAFISLPDNKTGLVHISEVSNTYVSDIRQHLTEGQDVKVMVISLDNGKVNLSMKRLEPKPQRENFRTALPAATLLPPVRPAM